MSWALVDFSASVILFWRCAIAFILGEILHFFFNRSLFKNSWSDARLAMSSGLALGFSLFLQTYGLNFTTATNSGFITSMYVILIPIITALLYKDKIKPHHIILSLMAFTGMGFLLNLKSLHLQLGEILTLGAALTAAFQIIFIGRVAPHIKSAFRFNTYLVFWCWISVLPFLVIETRVKKLSLWPDSTQGDIQLLSVFSIVALALLVSLLAFYLQVRAQRTLSVTTSSMLCLLEGPFSFAFAAYFLSERLSGIQFIGAFIILLSCGLSVFFDRPKSHPLHILTKEQKQPK